MPPGRNGAVADPKNTRAPGTVESEARVWLVTPTRFELVFQT